MAEAVPVAVPVATPAAAVPAATGAAAPGIFAKVTDLCKKNKWLLPAVAALLVVVIAVSMIVGAIGKRVSLDKYMKVEATGYNAYGVLKYELDKNSLTIRALGEKEYKEYGSFNPDDLSDEEKEAITKKYSKNLTELVQKFMQSVKVNVELPEGKTNRTLSNGDVVKFEILFDEALAKQLDLTIQDTTLEYTVSGLGEMQTYNVLANFGYEATGFDGNGSGKVICTKSETVNVGDLAFTTEIGSSYITYVDKNERTRYLYVYNNNSNYGLSNGDVITLKVDDVGEDYLATYGVKLAELSKDITISSLQGYTDVNLLSYLSAAYTGLTGSGRAELVITPSIITVGDVTFDFEDHRIYLGGESMGRIYAYASRTSSLRNGDTIELYFDVSDSVLASCGVKMPEKRKEVTVSGLAEYVTSLDQLNANADGLVDAGMVIVNDYINDDWAGAVHNSWWGDYSGQYIGNDMALYAMVLTTPKSTTSSTKNTLWLIYRVTLQDNTMERPTQYYFAVSQNNIAVDGDGSVMETISYKNKYFGYTSYEDLYKARIESYNLDIGEKILLVEENPIPVPEDPVRDEIENTEPAEPAETTPAEPVETTPAEPVETTPAEPVETTPAETAPTEPAEAEPTPAE